MQGQLFGARREPTVTYKRGVLAHYSRDAMIYVCEPRHYVCILRGKRLPVPRLEAWFHDDPTRSIQFGGGAPIYPRPFPDLLHQMRVEVQHLTGERFDSCFVNVYRSGRDSIDWHAEDAAWIGPTIASVTLGNIRTFEMKPKDGGPERVRYELGQGDLLVMHAGTQEAWLHRVPKTKKPVGIRLNATFRQTRKSR